MADNPDVIEHPVFGQLHWLPKFTHWFTQLRQDSGEWLDVVVDPGDRDRLTFIEPAALLFQRAREAEPRIRREAVQRKLLELVNKNWWREEEPELTLEELMSRLDWTLVVIDTIVPITLHYDTGDLFGGHGAAVEVDEELRFHQLELWG